MEVFPNIILPADTVGKVYDPVLQVQRIRKIREQYQEKVKLAQLLLKLHSSKCCFV